MLKQQKGKETNPEDEDDFILPDFKEGTNIIRNDKKPKTAVLAIKFSDDGVLVAASYDKEIIKGKDDKN